MQEGIPRPVEVNPRYTASVEVLEYATGLAALALHRRVFDPAGPQPGLREPLGKVVGKAILFARAPGHVPDSGPWQSALHLPGPVDEMPEFADIPASGERLEPGRPVLTFFTRANSAADCLRQLRRKAEELDHFLFGR
jgi:predicted ATP-grasp superfamily ATP-dependent carboligase